MEKFAFLEHTADAKFQAFGKTMEEAFTNAALAMFSIIYAAKKIRPIENKGIEVKGKDLKSLLYNFLEELLFLLDSESFLLHDIETIKIHKKDNEYFLNAVIEGDRAKDEYELHGDIKAVTYNDMEIKEEKDKITLQVVVDI